MRRKKIATFITGLLVISPVFCASVRAAEEPSTQPARMIDRGAKDRGIPDFGGPDGDGPGPYRGDRPPPPDAGGPGPSPMVRGHLAQRLIGTLSPNDVSSAMQFMQNHSPERFKALQSLPDGEKKTNLENITTRAYLNWMRQGNEDPELYSVIIKRVHLEDKIFGLLTNLRSATPENQPAIKSQMRDEVARLVDVGIEERALRLDRLQRTIKAEQTKLADDSAHRDEVVNERLDTILHDEKGLVPTGGIGDNTSTEGSNNGKGGHGHRGGGGDGRKMNGTDGPNP